MERERLVATDPRARHWYDNELRTTVTTAAVVNAR
ncbi:hypothetical protein H4V95_001739 [Arthrobacter sp. CAN_C5]|nr:hypothetical protein [Arthrobacter sp. CAN_C5]